MGSAQPDRYRGEPRNDCALEGEQRNDRLGFVEGAAEDKPAGGDGRTDSANPSSIAPELVTNAIRANEFHNCSDGKSAVFPWESE